MAEYRVEQYGLHRSYRVIEHLPTDEWHVIGERMTKADADRIALALNRLEGPVEVNPVGALDHLEWRLQEAERQAGIAEKLAEALRDVLDNLRLDIPALTRAAAQERGREALALYEGSTAPEPAGERRQG